MTLAAVLLAAGMSACSSHPQPHAAKSASASVTASKPLTIRLPGVAVVTAPAGTFRGHGRMTVTAGHAVMPYGGSLVPAGSGIDVKFSGVTLVRPLTITFNVGRKPSPGDVPVVAHQLAGGS